jgi:hypothetical protein
MGPWVLFASAVAGGEVLSRPENGVAESRVAGDGKVIVLSEACLVNPVIGFEAKKLGADERGSTHDASDKCGRGCVDP